jgi:ferredoxin
MHVRGRKEPVDEAPETGAQGRGGELSAEYGIHMPQNAFLKAWENNDKIIARGSRKMDVVARNTKDGKRGAFFRNIPLDLMLSPMHTLFKPLYVKKFVQMTGAPADTPFDELIAYSDKNFITNADCNGCGLCARVCPVNNINIADGKPLWLHHCENCLACYNWCPNKAIGGGVAQKGYYYRHPKVKIAEFIHNNTNTEG